MWYHAPMKKNVFICVLLILLILGCEGPSKEAIAAPTATQNVSAEMATPAPEPSDAPVATPEPYPVNEQIFVPSVTASPTVEPTAAPTEAPTAEPTVEPTAAPTEVPAPKERYAVEPGVETVAWLSDTQHYANYRTKNLPDIYPVMTGFLRDKAKEMNLVYIVHTGDLVHVNNDPENWTTARAAMDLLSGIPTGVLAGNHDMHPDKGGYKNYWQYFGEKQYNTQECYGESFENNRGHYDLVTICGREYIFVYMSYDPSKKAMEFIVNSFLKYPDRVGILCLHDFITSEGKLSKTGTLLRTQVVAKCPNLYMVLCGHRYGFYTLEDAFDDDKDGVKERKVYEIMMNYQAAGKVGGGGYLRLMQFDEEKHEIRCVNYSPYYDDYDWLDDPNNREKHYEMDETSESFTLKMPWA